MPTSTLDAPIFAKAASTAVEVRVWPASDAYVVGRLLPGTRVEISHTWPGDPRWLAVPDVGWILDAPGALAFSSSTGSVTESHARVSGPSHLAGVLTGVAPLDSMIHAVVSADAEAIAARLAYQRVPCIVDPQAPGAPECPAGVTDRSVIDAFPRSVYEADASPIPRMEEARTIDNVVTLDVERPPRLYGVLEQRGVTIFETPYCRAMDGLLQHWRARRLCAAC